VVTIFETEQAENIKKRQFKTGKLSWCNATMTEFWNEALAALAPSSRSLNIVELN